MEKLIKWLIRKLVTFFYKHYSFYTYSWGIDEHTDLYVISEESYLDRHRFGLKIVDIDQANVYSKDEVMAILEEFNLKLSGYEDTDLIRVEYIRQDIQEKINALKGDEQ